MSDYQLATADTPAPQSIPPGFGGLHDWTAVDDAEKARRGWVRYDPPAHDPVHERIETAFAEDADGIWRATYTVVPGPAGPALDVAKAKVAARRWDEQTKGVTVPIAGAPRRFLSTKEGQTDIGNALQLAQASEAAGVGAFQMPWKSVDGFVTVTLADLVTVGMAIGAHIAGCFAREATIIAALDAAAHAEGATAYAVRDTLAAELDAGWPG